MKAIDTKAVRIVAGLGAGLAAVVISMTGAVGTASAEKPCPSNCHTPNTPKPKPPIIDIGPSCGGTGQPMCPMLPINPPPPPPA